MDGATQSSSSLGDGSQATKSEKKKQSDKKQKQKKPQQKQKEGPGSGSGQAASEGPTLSKAELRAQRRAVQEAQRAEKAKKGGQQQGSSKAKSASFTETPSNPKPKQPVDVPTAAGAKQERRVAYNVRMDDEKVQKKIAKKLAKQQVPQRSVQQKKVALFSHLHQYEKDTSLTKDISFSSGNLHPAIVKLGLQFAEGIISGSNARCLGLLCAFKKVIDDYSTPSSKEMSRDLEAKMKPHISFLNQCRPLSVSMGNAIKYLKLQISHLTPDLSEGEAKEILKESIDRFINERMKLASKAISETLLEGNKIQDGDVILTFGCSSLLRKILEDAHDKGIKFRVVVVDSRPRFEGKELIRRLVTKGIRCSYMLITAVSYIMKEVTRVFLGAHALLANGYVMSHAGTALVAMVAKSNNVPVLVCCETYKFCEKVQTDAFVYNELGDPDDLIALNKPNKPDILLQWRDVPSLYLLNLVYDVTPPDFVDIVVTEIGMIPCTSVPVVLRVKNPES